MKQGKKRREVKNKNEKLRETEIMIKDRIKDEKMK